MSARGHRVVGWLFIVVFGIVVVLMLLLGRVHNGWAPAEVQCYHGPFPTVGGPYYENTEVSGGVSLFPLGIDCTYDSPDDAIGPQTVHNYQLGPTILFVIGIAGIAGGCLLIVRGHLIDRR
ncbi:hypothetical protein [Herbiconiux sp. A18JL235]|uniref:DUF3592 domain-containing protein n=1 Tax=Herbiconiux sp. A18JL235 TaxID=3152363 RepID=A0AB39BJV8_9MICO